MKDEVEVVALVSSVVGHNHWIDYFWKSFLIWKRKKKEKKPNTPIFQVLDHYVQSDKKWIMQFWQ